MNRKLLTQITLLAVGCLLGLATARLIARNAQIHAGRADLNGYARRLLRTGDDLAAESDHAISAVLSDHLPFCSDQELTLMREFVFNASNVRDIGRVKDGKLYCSTGMGRFDMPAAMPAPSISIASMNIYADAPLMISKQTTGFITEVRGVTIVLNPEAYRSLDEGPLSYAGYFYDRAGARVLRGFGHTMPLTQTEIISGRIIERRGIVYQPLCAPVSAFCVVAAESRADILSRTRWLAMGFTIAGGALGAAAALIVILIYKRQSSLEKQLRRAVREGALTIAYQPILDLATETIVGAEALARWTKDDGESVRPDIFIPLAEETGFIGLITRFIVQRSISEFGDLLATGTFRVTINITAQDLTDPTFITHLESSVQAARVPASSIGIELTERSTIDREAATVALSQLKSAGHPVYIDDFGTGYSNLAYLHLLAIDAIKIDRSFTQTIGTEAVTASVVPQILDMAAQLNLQVAVEGIETREQADYFRKAGRGILGQGWLFGRPMPAGQLRQLLKDNPAKPSSTL